MECSCLEESIVGIEEVADQLSKSSGRIVEVSIPAEVAFDLDSFQKVQRDILGQLGCRACCSGYDIRFDIERRFVVDSNLEVRPASFRG
jgi:hypothetical protein